MAEVYENLVIVVILVMEGVWAVIFATFSNFFCGLSSSASKSFLIFWTKEEKVREIFI